MSFELEELEIERILLSRGYQEDLFRDLEGLRRAGSQWVANCPFCDDTKRHLYIATDKPVYYCQKCNSKGNWKKYLQEKKGFSSWEALQFLASEAGVRLSGGDSFRATCEARERKASILETAQEFFIESLSSKDGQAVRDYLDGRDYTGDDIQAMKLGAYTSQKALTAHLKKKGFSPKDMKEAGLLDSRFENRVAFLWKDFSGRASGLVARSILSAEEQLQEKSLPKYLYSKGLQRKDSLFGFESARGSTAVILLEGVLDALLLHSRGLKNVVAMGGTSLGAEQIQALEKTGTEEILLAPDDDKRGLEAGEKIIQALSISQLRPYVVSLPEGFKDADELVRKEDLPAFQECLLEAERGSRWLTRMLVRQHYSKTARGLDRALDSALSYIAGLQDAIEKKEALEVLQSETGLSDEAISTRREKHLQRASSRKAEQSLQETSRRLQESLREGNLVEAEIVLQSGLSGLRQSQGVETPEPYTAERLLLDISQTSEGLKTGWPSLDKRLSFPLGALSVIAGRPGHGKTAFMLNLLLQFVEKHPGKTFFFFSYEEAPSRLAIKLLMRMAGKVLHQKTNREAYINRLKALDGQEPEISKALSDFGILAEEGRLNLVEFIGKPVETLAPLISHLAERQEIGAIFVDYIQKVPVRKPMSPDYLNIKRVSQLLLEQAVSANLPLIVGAQFGRPPDPGGKKKTVNLANLRECGDIEQDANLVLGLWCDPEEDKEATGPKELEVNCLKYRDGEPGWKESLQFEGAIQKVSEDTRKKSAWE